jgi:hypothetical protein
MYSQLTKGVIAHGDYCDGPNTNPNSAYYITSLDLTNDKEKVVQWVKVKHQDTTNSNTNNIQKKHLHFLP